MNFNRKKLKILRRVKKVILAQHFTLLPQNILTCFIVANINLKRVFNLEVVIRRFDFTLIDKAMGNRSFSYGNFDQAFVMKRTWLKITPEIAKMLEYIFNLKILNKVGARWC